MLKVLAPAKINLVLEVLRKRKDDYHEISSIVTTVDLFDELFFEDAQQTSLVCDSPELMVSENLVMKAVNLLKSITGCNKNIAIKLVKKIPISAGLGGGSSDAATTLKTLNRVWHLNLTVKDLVQIADQLGSDVPFFIHGGIALMQGKGEKVRGLVHSKKLWFTILVPDVASLPYKTKQLYSLLSDQHFTKGEHIGRALQMLQNHEYLDVSFLFNTFDKVKLQAFPWMDIYWNKFEAAVSQEIHLAGSGPALYTIGKYKRQVVEMFTKPRSLSCRIYEVSSHKETQANGLFS